MKICPKCKKSYKDDELNYCLADGATLVKKRGEARVEHSRVNEIVAVVVLAAAVLVFLCLVSYSPSDPTLNTASSTDVQNWIGVVGAWIADLTFQAFGLVGYLLPALLALIAWRIFQSETLKPSIARAIGYALLVVTASSLLYMLDVNYGGAIGALIPYFAIPLLSWLGVLILLSTAFIASLLLITNLSFLGLYESFEMAKANFRVHFDEWQRKRAALAAEQAETMRPLDVEKPKKKRKGEAQPTITTGDAKKTAVGAAPTMLEVEAEKLPAQHEVPFPTIAGNDEVPDTVVEPGDEVQDIAAVPIKQTVPTGELNGGATGEIEAEDEPSTTSEADFGDYQLPGIGLLHEPSARIEHQERELRDLATTLAEKTKEFNVSGRVVNICPGPVVTTYEFKPDPGVKYSRVTGLVDDLCLALKAESIRIDRIPGKAYVGIEVPNRMRETIRLRSVIDSKKFEESESKLSIALGQTIDGLNYVADLAKMPHLLIAGATGAGKSVGVNSLVVSILYKAKPDEVKFIMVDPKRLELGLYADIPHLATPIITDPKRAAAALRWAVGEMERRYKDLASHAVRNIDGYNVKIAQKREDGELNEEGEPYTPLPFIVIIIDELADLMMVSGKEVEEHITRLAQMARAVGIHLVLATQRPSVDVITGLIKANFPARISFRVSSKVDSRTIIDANGAESLLGKGDMLFLPPATSQVIRVHGAFVDEKEIIKIVDHIKSQSTGEPVYDETITQTDEELDDGDELPGRKDPLFWDALKTVVNAKRGSTSLLQRHLRIGYGRAAAILDAMVREGYIGEMDGSTRARPVLQKAYDDLQDLAEMNDG